MKDEGRKGAGAMRLPLMLLLAGVLLIGCSKGPGTMAGGKPVEHWMQALRDPSPAVRKKAVAKLGNVGTADPAALPALKEALNDRDARVRQEAIVALVKLGSDAQSATAALAELGQRDRDPQVRSCARRALEQLQGHSKK
jgi:HEAT repeat protein